MQFGALNFLIAKIWNEMYKLGSCDRLMGGNTDPVAVISGR